MAGVGSISSLGVGSGLQLQDILDQLRAADEQASITPKQNKVADYQAQLDEFSVVKNKLYDMKSAALDLSLSSTFLGRTVTSSDEGVLTATAVEGASPQSTTLTVDAIARKSSWMSSAGMASQETSVYVPTSVESSTGVDNLTDTVVSSDGTLDITFGGSTSISVAVGPTAGVTTMTQLVDAINTAGAGSISASTFTRDGQSYLRIESATGEPGEANRVQITHNDTDLTLNAPSKTFAYSVGATTASIEVAADTTLSQLAALINDDTNNPGGTASIIDDGGTSPYRLVLKANANGEDNRISLLTQLPDMGLSEQTGADGDSLNARFSIDGIAYQRPGNSISDVIPGVTLDLQGTGTTTVSVAGNDSDLQDKITKLVTSYNDVVQEIEAKTAYDKDSGKFGVLARTTLRDLPYMLQNVMTATIGAESSANNIKSMFDLGLQFNRDGTITVDANTLSAALADDPSGVQAFFLGDEDTGTTGLADSLNERLTTLLANNGQVAAESDAAQSLIDSLNQQIDAETARLDKKYALMTTQFIQLDQFMSQMTSESNYLTSQFKSLSSGWGTGNNSSSS